MLRLYAYSGCSTCRNAIKWLKAHASAFEEIPIREISPSIKELSLALEAKGGDLRSLFNTSGMDYRAMNLKEKLSTLSVDDALRLLHENGNLVKRPFAIDEDRGVFLVGFKEPEWKAALLD